MQISKSKKNNTSSILDEVRFLLLDGEYDDALKILSCSIKGADCINPDVLAFKSILNLKTGNPVEAALYLKTALEIDNNSYNVLLAKSTLLLSDNKVSDALDAAKTAFKLKDTAHSKIILAKCLAASNNYQEAIDIIEDLCQHNRYYAEGFALLSKLYDGASNHQKSLENAERAVQLKPSLCDSWGDIAKYYSKNSQLEKCIAALEMASKYSRNNLGYKILLGEYLRISGNLKKSYLILHDIVENLPSDEKQAVAALINIGAVLQAANKDEEAIDYYKKALLLNPNLYQVENNIAKYYLKIENHQEAERHIRSAIRLKPKYHKGFHNLASLMRFQNKNDLMLQYHREAIQYALESYPEDFISPKKEPMQVDAGDVCLLAMHDALSELGIPFFLAFGTLLGLVRDGHLLPYDKDLDIGVPYDLPRRTLLQKLEYFDFIYQFSDKISDDKPVWNYGLTHRKTGICIDLFFFKHDGDSYITGIDSEPVNITWTFPYFDLQEAVWNDKKWLVPSPPDVFFESVYGKNWRTPDPYFNTVISGLNRNPESQYIALNSAYTSLYDSAIRCEWKKAIGFCKQIQRILHDPYIDTVDKWLEDRMNEVNANA